MSDTKPNKPGTTKDGETPRDPGDRQAVENQAEVTPDDYPKSDGGRPDYGSPKRKN